MAKPKKRESHFPKNLAAKVREQRTKLGLTQAQLAEKAGIETESISRLERGVAMPSLLKLEEIAVALKTSMVALIAASSTIKLDQASQITGWLEGLSEKQRNFVLEMTRKQCEFLKSKG
jgi:transcriptional regulator with XRE-family HTH domain